MMIKTIKCFGLIVFLVMCSIQEVLATGMSETEIFPEKRLHRASKAGSWYPGDPMELLKYLDELLQSKAKAVPGSGTTPIRAVIVPHAAYQYSGGVAAEAFKLLKGRIFKRVVVVGPAHTKMFAGLSVPDVTHEETLLGEIPVDVAAIKILLQDPTINMIPGAHEREHSIEMELPLLQRTLAPGWQLLPILVGQLNREGFRHAADVLRPLLDEETLLVISGDFTHYGLNFNYQPFANDEKIAAKLRDLDMGAVKHIFSGNPEAFIAYYNKTGITACAFGPATLLMHLLGPQTGHEMLRYETSGSQSGDYSHSVSYIAMLFTDRQAFNAVATLNGSTQADSSSTQAVDAPSSNELSQEDMLLLHKMAIRALSLATSQGPMAVSSDAIAKEFAIPEHFHKSYGAFVTLKSKGELRGCIGFIQPIKPLFQAVIENAVNAALRDRRFYPVKATELAGLEVEVSVLSPTRLVDSYNDFAVGRHGVVLSKGRQSAVFLPEVATEQGWNREQTLSQLSKKAGLAADAWQEGSQFEVFTSQKYTAPYR